MKVTGRILLFTLSVVTALSSFAGTLQKPDLKWEGNKVFLTADIPATAPHRVYYAIRITIEDGTTQLTDGQADPPPGTPKHNVVVVTCKKKVKSATLASWGVEPKNRK
jgi:hypothetical protein